MTPRFNIPKAAQVAALFLKASGGKRMHHIRLLKLMYVLERESWKERGRPVTGDLVFAMKFGPVLSYVYNLIKGEAFGGEVWNKLLRKDNHHIELIQEPESFDELSDWEVRKIHAIVAEFADMNRWELIDELHKKLPEWKRHEPDMVSSKRNPIPIEEILTEVGRANEIEEIEADLEARNSLMKLLGGDR